MSCDITETVVSTYSGKASLKPHGTQTTNSSNQTPLEVQDNSLGHSELIFTKNSNRCIQLAYLKVKSWVRDLAGDLRMDETHELIFPLHELRRTAPLKLETEIAGVELLGAQRRVLECGALGRRHLYLGGYFRCPGVPEYAKNKQMFEMNKMNDIFHNSHWKE